MKLKNSLLFLLLIYACFCNAQNFNEDYKKAQASYLNLKKFSCDIQISMFERTSSVSPQQTMRTNIKKEDQRFLYVTGKTIMLMNEHCILNVYQQEKRITYSERSKKQIEKSTQENYLGMADSLLKKNDSVTYSGEEDGKKKYTVYAKGSIIKRTDVYIDIQSNLFTKLVYYYDSGKSSFEKVIISYDHISISPSFSDEDFSEKKYVIHTGKELKATSAYAGYKTILIDNTSN